MPSMKKGDYGLIGPLVLFGGLFAVIGFWPAMVWHGEGGPTGTAWRWDIHSTAGCLVWWFVLACVLVPAWADARSRRAKPPVVPPQPAGPDPAVMARLLRGLEAVEGYAGLVEQARTGEELDYLQRHGRLPDGWPFRDPHRKGRAR